MPRPRPTEERFWEKIRKTDSCWNWIGAISTTGYGNFWRPETRSFMSAHRVSWELHYGKLPEGARDPRRNGVVMHQCDNHACVRPDHLFLGSFQDNSRDMVAKGRGIGAPQKVTDDDVVAIRTLYYEGESQFTLARVYRISQRQVGRIVRRTRREAVA
jgi:HNH endonuclease